MIDQPFFDVQVPYLKNGDNYEFINFLEEIVPPYPGDESVFDSPFPSPQSHPKPDTDQHLTKRTFHQMVDPSKIKPDPVRTEDYLTPIGYRTRSHPVIPDEKCRNMTLKPKFSSEKINVCSDHQLPENSTKQNRKRKVMNPSLIAHKIKTEQDSISLSREELLSFSSEQFEDFVLQITAVRDLSQSEKNEIKRQRRLIKNRESAQASRQRKKSHIDELERKVKDLGNENIHLKEKISSLDHENTYLKKELTQLQAFVNKLNRHF